jgi:Na+-transporting methylmalonyl-CoA/oxaloacetate decarboxylase beta subunit
MCRRLTKLEAAVLVDGHVDQHNFLLMHAMGPNVGGVIGSAVAAGVMIKYLA